MDAPSRRLRLTKRKSAVEEIVEILHREIIAGGFLPGPAPGGTGTDSALRRQFHLTTEINKILTFGRDPGVTAPLKAAGIGAGCFCAFTCDGWSRIPEVHLAAVAHLPLEKARAMAAQFGIPRHYSDWQEMIAAEQPGFVDIITPPATHKGMCRFAAARRPHGSPQYVFVIRGASAHPPGSLSVA